MVTGPEFLLPEFCLRKPFQGALVTVPTQVAPEEVSVEEVHILCSPFIGDKCHDSAVAPVFQPQAGLFPDFPQETVLRTLPFFKFTAYAHPLVVIEIVLFPHSMEHQVLSILLDIAQGRISHVEF